MMAGGCVISALAPDVGTVPAGRLIQGLGSGWISGFAMVAIALLFPERHLARVFAAVTFIWGIATVLGPLFGGAVLEAGTLARRVLAVRRPGAVFSRRRAAAAARRGEGRRGAGDSLAAARGAGPRRRGHRRGRRGPGAGLAVGLVVAGWRS